MGAHLERTDATMKELMILAVGLGLVVTKAQAQDHEPTSQLSSAGYEISELKTNAMTIRVPKRLIGRVVA